MTFLNLHVSGFGADTYGKRGAKQQPGHESQCPDMILWPLGDQNARNRCSDQ